MRPRYRKEIPLVPVENPVIGQPYHLKWARSRGMVWILLEIQGDKAIMRTPKTKKQLIAKVSDLMHTRSQQARLKPKAPNSEQDVSAPCVLQNSDTSKNPC